MRVTCVTLDHDDTHYDDLILGEEYFVYGVEANHYRVVSAKGAPYLFPRACFEMTDGRVQGDWVFDDTDGGCHLALAATDAPGFYEELFGSIGASEGQVDACETFRRALDHLAEISDADDAAVIRRDLARFLAGKLGSALINA